MRKNKKRIISILAISIICILIDRIFFVSDRTRGTWQYISGTYLGDPIAYGQDYKLVSNKMIFTRNKSKFNPVMNKNISLIGCYFGNLYLYDNEANSMIRYSRFK